MKGGDILPVLPIGSPGRRISVNNITAIEINDGGPSEIEGLHFLNECVMFRQISR